MVNKRHNSPCKADHHQEEEERTPKSFEINVLTATTIITKIRNSFRRIHVFFIALVYTESSSLFSRVAVDTFQVGRGYHVTKKMSRNKKIVT